MNEWEFSAAVKARAGGEPFHVRAHPCCSDLPGRSCRCARDDTACQIVLCDNSLEVFEWSVTGPVERITGY